MATVDPDQLAAAVADFMLVPRLCSLCGGRAVAGGAFIPDRPWEFGGPPPGAEKVRVIIYALCSRCIQSDGVAERVEMAFRVDGPQT